MFGFICTKNTSVTNFVRDYNIFFFAALISLGLSLFAQTHHQPVNNDGILYIETADTFLKHGLRACMAIYSWPFYSILIALFSELFFLPLLKAAFLLNAILMAGAAAAFIALIHEMQHSNQVERARVGRHTEMVQRRILWLSVLVFSICHYLNHYRTQVIRGYGYLFFALLALIYLIRFLRRRSFSAAFFWNVFITLAALFRIEAGYFAVALPFLTWFQPSSDGKGKAFLQLNLFVGLGCLLVAVWFLLDSQARLSHLGRIEDMIHQVISGFTLGWSQMLSRYELIQSTILMDNSTTILPFILLMVTWFGLFLQTVVKTIEWPFLLLAGYALYIIKGAQNTTRCWHDRRTVEGTEPSMRREAGEHLSLKDNEDKHFVSLDWAVGSVFSAVIFLNIAMCLMFLATHWFFSSRFFSLSLLLMMALVPFRLYHLHTLHQKPRWLLPITYLSFLYLAIAGLGYFGPSKSYLIDAGEWIANRFNRREAVLTNNKQFGFYTYHPIVLKEGDAFQACLKTGCWRNYTIVGVNISKKSHHELKKLETFFGRPSTMTFENRRGDLLVIFL